MEKKALVIFTGADTNFGRIFMRLFSSDEAKFELLPIFKKKPDIAELSGLSFASTFSLNTDSTFPA
jgi:hypothetical protein